MIVAFKFLLHLVLILLYIKPFLLLSKNGQLHFVRIEINIFFKVLKSTFLLSFILFLKDLLTFLKLFGITQPLQ